MSDHTKERRTSISPDDRTRREVEELMQHFGYGPRQHTQVYEEAVHDLYKRFFQPEPPRD